MDSKIAVNIGIVVAIFVFGGIFFTMASDGDPMMGLIGGALIGVVSGMMALGMLSPLIKKDEPAHKTEASQKPESNDFSDPESQFKLGQAFRLGLGVEKNSNEAFEWIKKSAGKGYSEAQNMLGFMYSNGEGVDENIQEAIVWYRLASENGNSIAQTNLGLLFSDEDSQFVNYQEAVKLLQLAAENGQDLAQERLAYLYYKGHGVEVDFVKAAKWYRLATAQDNIDAERMLNVMMARGEI